MDVQQVWYHLLKSLSFLHWNAFVLLSKISRGHLCTSISGLSILFYQFVYPLTPYSLDYCNYMRLKIGETDSSHFIPLTRDCFKWSNVCLTIQFWNNLCGYIYKNVFQEFDRNCLKQLLIWRKMISLLLWVVQSMNTICISIYLKFSPFISVL